MLRFFAGAGSAVLLMLAGFFVWKSVAQKEEPAIPPAPETQAATGAYLRAEPPPKPPASDEKTKEERRFDRADRDNDGLIMLEELYQPRRKAFSKLDANGDGRLSFEEWAVRTREKFVGADANRDRQLTRAEYATTAPKRRPKPKCNC